MVAGVALYFTWKGVRSTASHFFAERFYRQACQYADAKEVGRAAFSARKVLSFNPQHEGALALMARIAGASNSAEAMDWLYRLVAVAPSASNQLMLVRAGMRFEPPPYPSATHALESLEEKDKKSLDYFVTAAQYNSSLGHIDEAARLYLEALKLSPTNSGIRLGLATMQVLSSNPTAASQAETLLKQYADDTPAGLAACRSLVAVYLSRKNFPLAKAYAARVIAKSQEIPDRHMYLDVLQAAGDPEFTAVLAAEQGRMNARPDQVSIMALWMNSHRLSAEAMAWIKQLPAPMQQNRLVVFAYADCLEALKDWPGLIVLLRSQNWSEQEHYRRALLIRTLRQAGKTAEADAEWRALLAWGSVRPRDLHGAARNFEIWKWADEADACYWVLLEQNPDDPRAFGRLALHLTNRQDTRGLLRLFAVQLKAHPDSIVAKNNVAMYSLLLKTNLADAHRLAAELFQAQPKNPIIISTYAFSLYVQGQPKEALKTFETIPVWQIKDPGLMAYYGIFLTACAQAQKGQDYLDKASRGNLLPEEQELVRRAIPSLPRK